MAQNDLKNQNNNQIMEIDITESDEGRIREERAAFQRSTKLLKSPILKMDGQKTPNSAPTQKVKQNMKTITRFMLDAGKSGKSAMEQAVEAVKEMRTYVDDKKNIHNELKTLLLRIELTIDNAEREYLKLSNELAQTTACANQTQQSTPVGAGNTNKKRKTTSPLQAPKIPQVASKNDEPKWRTIQRKEKKPKQKKGAAKPKVVRPKADALAIGIKDGKSETFSDVLKKIKSDPSLVDLGKQVSRIRKSRNGEMLIEFRADSTAKSSTFKEILEKTVGEGTTVKALTQEIVLECLNLDEVTTGDELRSALKTEFALEDQQCDGPIRMRKSYGSTQIATIKMAIPVANKILEVGKVKVGWSVCSLRVSQQPLRCFKCLGFGHQSKNCKGLDRSKACWKCGVDGHQSKDCSSAPKCLLCSENDGNSHPTGSLKCKAYKDAISKRAWR